MSDILQRSHEATLRRLKKLRDAKKASRALERRKAWIMKPAPEATVARHLRDAIKKANGLILKVHPLTFKGVPDYLVHVGGRTLYVETKTTGKTCSPAQREAHKILKEHGVETYVLDRRIVELDELFMYSYKTYETNPSSRYYREFTNEDNDGE